MVLEQLRHNQWQTHCNCHFRRMHHEWIVSAVIDRQLNIHAHKTHFPVFHSKVWRFWANLDFSHQPIISKKSICFCTLLFKCNSHGNCNVFVKKRVFSTFDRFYIAITLKSRMKAKYWLNMTFSHECHYNGWYGNNCWRFFSFLQNATFSISICWVS